MQAHFLSASIFALTLAMTAPAVAEPVSPCPEQPVCGYCGADISVLQAEQAAAVGQDVQTQAQRAGNSSPPPPPPPPPPPSSGGTLPTEQLSLNFVKFEGESEDVATDVQTAPQANTPIFLELDGVPGESSEAPSSPPPPPPPPPQQSGGDPATDGLLVLRYMFGAAADEASPANVTTGESPEPLPQDGQVRVRVTINPGTNAQPQADGVVVLTPTLPSGEAGRGGGTLTLSSSSPPAIVPEQPVCDHCGADAEVQTQNSEQATILLVPAVQRVREAAARSRPPQQAAGDEDGVVPEMPICGHCGADSEVGGASGGVWRSTDNGAEAAQQEEPRRERRRGGFSLSIGGITLGSDGGVNVAVGDVTGDGRGDNAQRGSDRPAPSARPARRTASAARRN